MGVLSAEGVLLRRSATDKDDALVQCAEALVALGAVGDDYLTAMRERESQISTFLGEGVAIPHGTHAALGGIRRAAIAFLQFPEGVDWDGQDVRVCIPIASRTDEHVDILSALATTLSDPAAAAALREAEDVDAVLALMAP
ncbi:PTS sugar transporter subunit IIA [Demequina sp. NBRC 110054]|uniref:PTS sugar transporter subunit IIA n=1 Tax=Demequina sp. NBRC 110054 TaxID=1570343 RepID=UPI000A0596D8|nr:PTS sugar transporter subunit IIA [Demequina sp. NBRC 110054]